MRKTFLSILAVLFLWGCSVKTYTLEKERVDLQVAGNQGFLSGTPNKEKLANSRLGDKRKISVVEVELGRRKKVYKCIKPDVIEEEIAQEEVYEPPAAPVSKPEPVRLVSRNVSSSKDNYQWYTVQKDDTLQKISYKFYNTTRKWMLIFEENKDILKSPDEIFPGKKIKIPNLN